MKKLVSLFALFSLLTCLSPFQAHAQLGIAAGLNFDELSDISGSREATFDNANGYHVGVFYDLGLSMVGLRIGAFYRDVGDVDVSLDGVEGAFDLSMVDIPIDVRFNISSTPFLKPYIVAGPVLSFPSSGDDEFKDALEDVTVSGNVGVGVALNLGGIRIYPELRYAIGVSRFMKDSFSIGNVEFETDELQRQNSVMLRLGIGF